MTAAARLFESGVHSVLLQFPLKSKQCFQSVVKVGVNRYPFRSLCFRIDRVQTDGDVAIEMHTDYTVIERFWLSGLPIPRRVIRNGTVRQRPFGLDCVRSP